MSWMTGEIPTKLAWNVRDFDPTRLSVQVKATQGTDPQNEAEILKHAGGPGKLSIIARDDLSRLWRCEIKKFLEDYSISSVVNELNIGLKDMLAVGCGWTDEQVAVYAPEFYFDDSRLRLRKKKVPDFTTTFAMGYSSTAKRIKINARDIYIAFDPNLACLLRGLGFRWKEPSDRWWEYQDISLKGDIFLVKILAWPDFIKKAKYPVTLPEPGELLQHFYLHTSSVMVKEKDLMQIDPALKRPQQLAQLMEKILMKELKTQGYVTNVAVEEEGEELLVTFSTAKGCQCLRITFSDGMCDLLKIEGNTHLTTPSDSDTTTTTILKAKQSAPSIYRPISAPFQVALCKGGRLGLHVAQPEVSHNTILPLLFSYKMRRSERKYRTTTRQIYCEPNTRYCTNPKARFVLPGYNDLFTYDLSSACVQVSARMLNANGMSMVIHEAAKPTETASLQVISDVKVWIGDYMFESSNGLRPVRDHILQMYYGTDPILTKFVPDSFLGSKRFEYQLPLFPFNTGNMSHFLSDKRLTVEIEFSPGEYYINPESGVIEKPFKRHLKLEDCQISVDRGELTESMKETLGVALKHCTPMYSFMHYYLSTYNVPPSSDESTKRVFSTNENVRRYFIVLQPTDDPVNANLQFPSCDVRSISMKQGNNLIDEQLYVDTNRPNTATLLQRMNTLRHQSKLPPRSFDPNQLVYTFENTQGHNSMPVEVEIVFNKRTMQSYRVIVMAECEEQLVVGIDGRIRRCSVRYMPASLRPRALQAAAAADDEQDKTNPTESKRDVRSTTSEGAFLQSHAAKEEEENSI